MDLLKPIVRYVTRPLYDLKEGQFNYAFARHMQKSQYLDLDSIREEQLLKLKAILAAAAESSKFYRDRFQQAGVRPDRIASLDDLSRIPTLTKDDIRENLESILSSRFSRENLHFIRTGGSTGVPVRLYADNGSVGMRNCAALRSNAWAGYRPGDKLAALWGNTDKPYSLKEKLRNYLLDRVIYLDTLKMNDRTIEEFLQRQERFRAEILMGHSHSVYTFARFLADHGLPNPGFRSIITTAEMLYDHERSAIESVFGKIVFNRYGCEEVGLIASECQCQDGLHINADGLIVEVIGGDQMVPGRLIITDLTNYAVPLIRYEIGDLATVKSGTCACGRTLPRLARIFGRTTDFLYTPDKTAISGVSILDTFVIHIPGIKQTQIVQDRFDHLDFYIVKGSHFSETSLTLVQKNVTEIFGPRMRLDVHFVDQIAQTERGKYRFSICNIPREERP